jgi:hypothetical protein
LAEGGAKLEILSGNYYDLAIGVRAYQSDHHMILNHRCRETAILPSTVPKEEQCKELPRYGVEVAKTGGCDCNLHAVGRNPVVFVDTLECHTDTVEESSGVDEACSQEMQGSETGRYERLLVLEVNGLHGVDNREEGSTEAGYDAATD